MTLPEVVRILGGPRRVALEIDVTPQTVYNWLTAGRVHQARHAIALAELMLSRGHRVSLWELADYRRPAERERAIG